jgi:uncharacterized membrane protein YfcA
MLASGDQIWKLSLTLTLLLAILLSVTARAPRERVSRAELRRLLAAALVLYAVGALASLTHRDLLAGIVYASGILVCSLAVWLSRGVGRDDGGGGGGGSGPPGDKRPPTGPHARTPTLDWDEFDRERAGWDRRHAGV